MPRPRKCRRVQNHPPHGFYKPQGVPLQDLKGVTLPVEGLEALRLADGDGLDHEEAARRMDVSRPTFSRILSKARQQVARALSNGWAIRIEGGDYAVAPHDADTGPMAGRSSQCGSGFRCGAPLPPGGPDIPGREPPPGSKAPSETGESA